MLICVPSSSQVHGTGLFCNKSNGLEPGERILAERPILEVATNGDQQATMNKMLEDIQKLDAIDLTTLQNRIKQHNKNVGNMSPDEFTTSLSNQDQTTLNAVSTTVSLRSVPFSGNTDATVRRLFKNVSLINHSCAPNAELQWDDSANAKRIVLRATTSIAKDEEILISYINPFQDRSKRHSDLGFPCSCSICSLTGQHELATETKIQELAQDFAILDTF